MRMATGYWYAFVICVVGCQNFSYGSEPRKIINVEINKPVNFTRVMNACYISSMLQALIALPTWRSYIMNYPPKGCTRKFKHDILMDLRALITNYVATPLGGMCRIENFHRSSDEKGLVWRSSSGAFLFSVPDNFFEVLNKVFLGYRYNEHVDSVDLWVDCSLYGPFIFTRKDGSFWRLPINYLSKTEDFIGQPSLYDLIVNLLTETDGSGHKTLKKFTQVSQILCIESSMLPVIVPSRGEIERSKKRGEIAYSFPGTLIDGRPYKIPQELNITEFVDPAVRGDTNIIYRLASIIWQATNHIIAYVKYGGLWYVCDDLSYEPCKVVSDALRELERGSIMNKYGYPLFLPSLLFYERVQQSPLPAEKSNALPDLHASLTLLAM